MVDSILLMSGGIDSATLAFNLDPDLAITIDYGQRPADAEISASQNICQDLNISHDIIRIDLSESGTGTMANGDQLDIASTPEWWPFRNQLLITVSSIAAVKRGAEEIIIGTVKEDRNHADGTPDFLNLIDELVSIQEGGLNVSAPARDKTSIELVSESNIGLDILSWTHSCHTSNRPCGMCRGCVKRQETIDHIFK